MTCNSIFRSITHIFLICYYTLSIKTPFYIKYVSLIYHVLFPANMERSNLYLKLFKLVFGSVSLLAAENEQMLKVS